MKRTVRPIATGSVSAEPARFAAPGAATRPLGVELDLLSAERVDAGRHAGRRHRVGDQDRPGGRLRADHRADRGRRQVVPVDDEAREQAVLAELLPDQVRVPGQRRARSRCRGGSKASRPPRTASRIWAALAAVWPIATSTPAAARCSTSGSAPGDSGASVTRPDPSLGRFLAPLEVVDLGRAHVLARVGAARPVLGRDVGALHVDAGERRVAALAAASARRPRTSRAAR